MKRFLIVLSFASIIAFIGAVPASNSIFSSKYKSESKCPYLNKLSKEHENISKCPYMNKNYNESEIDNGGCPYMDECPYMNGGAEGSGKCPYLNGGSDSNKKLEKPAVNKYGFKNT